MTDRELDILIGEKIFNLTIKREMANTVNCHPKQLSPNCPSCGYDAFWNESELPNYSTNIEHAWVIVEKMQAQSWDFELSKCHEDEMVVAVFQECPEDDSIRHRGESNSASKSICLAALKAVGMEIN